MILNSKQLEELESIHDTVAEFEEESGETESFDEGAESALAWRRGMIEKAAANVKKAARKFPEPNTQLTVGTLIFDKNAKKFGRVTGLVGGSVQFSYLSTTEITLSPKAASKKAKAEAKAAEAKMKAEAKEKAAPKAAKKIAAEAKSAPVVAPTLKAKEPAPVAKKAVAKAAPVKAEKKAAPAKPTLKAVTKSKAQKKPAPKPAAKKPVKVKAKIKVVAKKKSAPKVTAKTKKPAKAQKKKPTKRASIMMPKTPRGFTADPVGDPNGYIRQNFQLMNNRELAHVTGLSEHTIRRKLGEWGLKRIKR